MSGGKNKDEWDDLADKAAAEQGISPEIARAVLATNPTLRAGGMSTDMLVKQSKPNQQQGKVAPKPGAPASGSLVDVSKVLDKRLADAKTKREKDIADAEQHFAAEKKALLESLTQWLHQNDPELRSPFTQQVLEQKKALLQAIGFDVKAYVAAKMKR